LSGSKTEATQAIIGFPEDGPRRNGLLSPTCLGARHGRVKGRRRKDHELLMSSHHVIVPRAERASSTPLVTYPVIRYGKELPIPRASL
jgi:hypothetical protein